MTYRVGEHYGIHVYEDERPVATFHDADEAARFVLAMNRESGQEMIEVADLAGNVEQIPGQLYIYDDLQQPDPLFTLLEQVSEGDKIWFGNQQYTVGERMSTGTTVMMGPEGQIVRFTRGDE